jgi:hypothetical protein
VRHGAQSVVEQGPYTELTAFLASRDTLPHMSPTVRDRKRGLGPSEGLGGERRSGRRAKVWAESEGLGGERRSGKRARGARRG